MSAWTGGTANREYRRGSRAEEVVTGELRRYLRRQVMLYLADCRRFRLEPSEGKCLQVVYTANEGQKQAVRDLYAEAAQ